MTKKIPQLGMISELIKTNQPGELVKYMKEHDISPNDFFLEDENPVDNQKSWNMNFSRISVINIAVMQDRPECLKALLTLPCDLDREDDAGWNPVSLAARHGVKKCLNVLLEYPCNLELKNYSNDSTPLIFAISEKSFDCTDLLLHKGANPKAKRNGRTAISVAIQTGETSICELLINHGAVNPEDWHSPLLDAIELNKPQVIETLLAVYPGKNEKTQQIHKAREHINHYHRSDKPNYLETRNSLHEALNRIERMIAMESDVATPNHADSSAPSL